MGYMDYTGCHQLDVSVLAKQRLQNNVVTTDESAGPWVLARC